MSGSHRLASLGVVTLPLFEEPAAGRARPITLVRLAAEIARATSAVGTVAVEGEVHRPTTSKGGWVFFTLRDRAAQVPVVVPRTRVARARTVAGERVRVTGSLEWSADRGALSLRAEEVVPVGEGAVAALIAETRARLAAAGLLDRRRRHLPLLPATIGVICGADAAVRADIESVVAARFPGYPTHFEETTVSGPGAVPGICDALQRIARRRSVEVVILARGGGDATSLLPWSDEEVCRAVAACPVPVVSAIGHEGDRPLCDEVADLRAGTPSLAAAAVVPDRAALSERLAERLGRAERSWSGCAERAQHAVASLLPDRSLEVALQTAHQRVRGAGRRLEDVHPRRRLADCRRRLDALEWARPTGEVLGRASGRLEASARHLVALDPGRVLGRGYAVARNSRGQVVSDAGSLAAGDRVEVTVAVGSFVAAVEEVRRG